MDPVPLQKDQRQRLISETREWLKRNSRKGDTFGRSQWDIYLAELAEGVLRHVLATGGGSDELYEKLSDAGDLLAGIKSTITPVPYNKSDKNRYRDLSDEDFAKVQKRVDAFVWSHKEPQRALSGGYTSEHYINFDRQELWHEIAKYLERPWLHTPALEWILVDAMVYHELVQFGDEVKKKMPGPLDSLGINAAYFAAEGDLTKMGVANIKWRLAKLGIKAAVFIGAPLLAILWAIQQGHLDAAILGGAAYLALMIVWTIWKRVHRLIRKPKKTYYEIALELWSEMSDVYRLLNPPIIDPTLVKEALLRTRGKGAVWDTPVYSLVERAIARDSHTWVADPWTRPDRLITI